MKKVKQILFSCSVFLFSSGIYAQQESIITMYTEQMNIVNPAFAGVDGTSLSIGNRKQWMGVNNASVSQMLVFGTSLGKNVGLGISAIGDKTFIENKTNIGVDFSYKLKMNPETDLFLGIKAGGNFHDINTSGLLTFNPSSDPGLLPHNSFNPNIGVGALLKKENSYLSLSIPRLLNTVRARNEGDQTYISTVRPHVYLSGGYEYDLETSSEFILKPSFMLRYVKDVPVSMDLNLGINFYKNFEIGVLYRSNKAMGGMAKINLSKRFLFGYAYESATRTDLARSMNTNEFILKYNFSNRSKQ
jgi:type IX secretion system PorP/SprF family membrane protein